MAKKLFLLDGMALVYRAHFAFITRPILTSKGVNTSALYGFTQTLLDIVGKQQPTHLAVAFDTAVPTRRHTEYPEYKATREAMPEELSAALPSVRRMVEAFRIPVLTCDGFEADDIIGTLVLRAEADGFVSYMVTPDKDFGQLLTEKTFIYKPGRAGDAPEILGVPEIKARWGVQSPEHVVDVLALMGDSTDNIPGVPGIGEKTAIKLIGQYGTVENLLAHTADLTGKLKENLTKHAEDARLSKRLATIDRDVPCQIELDALKLQPHDEARLKALLLEFEFNSIGRRIFGGDFKAGPGFATTGSSEKAAGTPMQPQTTAFREDLFLDPAPEASAPAAAEAAPPPASNLKTIKDVEHDYKLVSTTAQRSALIAQLNQQRSFCFDTETTGLDSKEARLVGIAFAFAAHTGFYVPFPLDDKKAQEIVEEFRPSLESENIEKVGHNLKYDLGVLKRYGVRAGGRLFDTMIAHCLIEPDQRHGMDYLSEVHLGYTPVPITALIGDAKGEQINMSDVPVEKAAEYAAEDADVTWQLRAVLEPLLKAKGQERVFWEVESPLIPALMEMEHEGIKVDAAALAEFSSQLAKEIEQLEKKIHLLAGTPFNLNSARQLGQVLFEQLKVGGAPKKTRTGQYATDEQTLTALAQDHEIVRLLLEYRGASKLKSTYADALPETIKPATGRVHTTFNQAITATGRLNSQDPNLQNIPIRTELGREIRRAFVPRGKGYKLLSADYSQIELRIIAALSKETGLIEAFRSGEDVHTATAARVFGVMPGLVTPEMRRKAKMVNYGIAYGISAFGLSQRLRIPRKEAAAIINQYFAQFSGIRLFMEETIAFAREHGFVQTVTGRRRYLRDIRSANNTIRGAAERNAINAPIQGTAADMIKIAMVNIHRELARRKLKTAMLLQVHDELVFDLFTQEEKEVRALVEEKMTTALPMEVPIVVEIGVGDNWLEAH
jgi:DNA polymerase-1